MEPGIGSGLGLGLEPGQAEPVGDAAAGQNQLSRGPDERKDREEHRRRKESEKEKEAEKISANDSAENASRGKVAEGAGEGVCEPIEEASERNEGSEGDDERPPHRVDSLA